MIRLSAWCRADRVPSSAVVWRGRSLFDNSPLVAIVTGLHGDSANTKTGAGLAQLWILREDLSPLSAIATGADLSICGNCPHRGDGTGKARSCYVSVKNAPRAVWAAYQRGRYPRMTPADVAVHLASMGMGIRIGAYGDGAAIPVAVIAALTSAARHTGYTHAWRTRADLSPYLMASCDTPAEQAQASAEGWRTFRVRTSSQELGAREISCPASEEAGKRTTCATCGLCNGATAADARKDIAIIVHGIGTRAFTLAATIPLTLVH